MKPGVKILQFYMASSIGVESWGYDWYILLMLSSYALLSGNSCSYILTYLR